MLKLPASLAKTWENLKPHLLPGFKVVAFTSLTVSSLVIGMKHQGWLQPLELRIYDRMVRYQPDSGLDSRLLLVEITEADIQGLKRSTPSDQTVAQLLANLERHQPQVVGLDLYRDVPQEPGSKQLAPYLQSPRLIAITKLGSTGNDSIPAPANVPASRIGFNDFVVDSDGVIRRNLLFATTPTDTYFSFSLRLALQYLNAIGITPQASAAQADNMQLGNAVFVPLLANSGSYQSVDDSGYQILLSYRSRRAPARSLTLTQVLNNQFDPSWVRGKIVLIGTTAASGKDLFYTPYSAGEQTSHQMPGVVLHAQMVSQILGAALDEQPLFWFWTERQEWLWIWGWTLVSGGIAWWLRHPLVLGVSSVGILVVLGGAGFLLLTHHGWVPVMAPAIATIMAIGTVVAYRAQQAHRQQQMVMTLLGQNTSPEIADALWQSRDRLLESGKLPGKRLIATMLFTDIKGFSTLSESMSPEALLEWLNEYLEAMTQEIQHHHGIINKFTGDGLLAVFGVPMPRLEPREVDEDAYQSVACALAMGRRLEQLNQEWEQRGLMSVQMRVGIFTGTVVVGSLGGKDRMEYGVIGDSVNTASRLESCLKERHVDLCRVLISQETLVHLKGRFVVESWGPIALRGKQQLVEVYRVVGHAAPALRLEAASAKTTVKNTIKDSEKASEKPR